MTVLITGTVIAFCLLNHKHYAGIKRKIRIADEALSWTDYPAVEAPPQLDPAAPTAVFVVGSSRSGGVYALQWVRREFPGHFKNFIFMNVRTVDAQSYGGNENLESIREEAQRALTYFVNYCNTNNLAAKSYLAFGTDPIEELTKLAETIHNDYTDSIFSPASSSFSTTTGTSGSCIAKLR
jgi:hypothetical protein